MYRFASSGEITPPTILQTSTLLGTGRQRCRWGRDTEDDVDFVVIDLDAFDEKPDQVALQRPIRSGHALPDLFCESSSRPMMRDKVRRRAASSCKLAACCSQVLIRC